jgi:methylthioribose-1-phosphate isomerase
MNVNGQATRSLWPDAARRGVCIIDQTRLPFAFETRSITSLDAMEEAIRAMRVRGAPLIGVAAVFGLALAMDSDASTAALDAAAARLKATRPTAVNLAWAVDRAARHLADLPHQARPAAAWAFAMKLADEDVATNAAIGEHGAELLRALHERLHRPVNVLTHCNAGWVATVDWGTALAAVYKAHGAGVPLHVYVDETRPRNQGLITAWELREHGVPHTVIVDNAGGHLMQRGRIDAVLVGADRVSRHGDVANKIGTYLKALAAHDNGVPFYAALPLSTIDFALDDAHAEIEIEEREAGEVRFVHGTLEQAQENVAQRRALRAENAPERAPDKEFCRIRVLDDSSAVANPGFDITPSHLISAIITERGVFAPTDIASLEGRA